MSSYLTVLIDADLESPLLSTRSTLTSCCDAPPAQRSISTDYPQTLATRIKISLHEQFETH
jgi:hypothetical protein